MKNQTSSSGRRLRRVLSSSVGAIALCGAATLFAQASSPTGTTPSYDTSGASTNTRTGNDRTRTGSGASTTATGSEVGSASSTSTGTGSMRASKLGDSSSLARVDRRFVTRAAEMNMEEVRLSELAAQQASNPEVRSFAQQLVTEHTQASTELTGLASRKGLDAMARDDYDQRAVTKLSKKSGSDFDKAYMEKMVDAHEDAVDLFTKASRDTKDPEIQGFASKMLPRLQQHLQHAKSLEQTVSGSSGENGPRSTMGSGASRPGSSTSGSSGAPGSSGSGTTR